MAAMGALLRYPLAMEFLMWTLICGAVIAIALIVARGQILFYARRFYISLGQPGNFLRPDVAVREPGHAMPFAVAATCGAAIVAWLEFAGPGAFWWPS